MGNGGQRADHTCSGRDPEGKDKVKRNVGVNKVGFL